MNENMFIPVFILLEVGIFLTFVKIGLNANRYQEVLPFLCGIVMYWIYLIFNLAIQLFYAGFSI